MLRKSLLCAALLFAGCDSAKTETEFDPAPFKDGLPSKDQVEVKTPKQNGQGLTALYGQGQKAEYYQLTFGATVTVNAGTKWVLDLISDITQYPPTTISDTQAVWGPHTDALSPTTWKLTVNKTGAQSYSWVLEGKAKANADSAFKAVLSGSHTVALNANGERQKGFGSGQFLIDWDASRTLPNANQNDMGTAEIRYSRTDAAAVASVEADFHQVRDENVQGGRVDAQYRYKQTPAAGGEFDFKFLKNIDSDPLLSKLEKLTIKSRWEQTGVGRSDIELSGGDLFGTATLSECWDSNFLSTYFTVSFDPRLGYGTAATGCGSFSAAVYSSL
jgi:hypothetical protein